MTKNLRQKLSRMVKSKKAASPAISMVIITSITVTLIIVATLYASQVLEREHGSSEFEAVQKSIISFDDGLRDIAWDKDSSRSASFSINYGVMQLEPETWPLVVNVTGYPGVSYSSTTGYVRYSLSTQYMTYGDGYESYFLGSNSTLSTDSTESFGRAVTQQVLTRIDMTLSYRIRAMKAYTVNVNQSGIFVPVSYVDIWIIRLRIPRLVNLINDFNLAARSLNITTISYGGPNGNGFTVYGGDCTINAQLGDVASTSTIPLDGQKVVFNFIITEIGVSN